MDLYRLTSTYSNVTDLLASQVPQLSDQRSEQFRLLFRKLRSQLLQQRLNLRQIAARSDPNTCRDAREAVKLYLKNQDKQKTTEGGYRPCAV